MLLLLLAIDPVFTAFCGSSAIPYRFEVLEDGSFSLGCARPSCFGWDGTTGSWASNDHAFATKSDDKPDGFLRHDGTKRPPFDIDSDLVNAQINSGCLVSSSCSSNQWAGGLVHNIMGGPPTLLCCTYPPLILADFRGVAVVQKGQFVMGGEVESNRTLSHFDYLRNIQPITRFDGLIYGYNVEMGRMSCTEPPPKEGSSRRYQAQYPYRSNQNNWRYNEYTRQWELYQQPSQTKYYPTEQTTAYFCFAADSTVTLIDGHKRRMDELKTYDWVQTPSDDLRNVTVKSVKSWLHRLPNERAEFMAIYTASGKTIKLTPRHYIYKANCSDPYQHEMVPAEELSIGDCLFVVGENQNMQPSEVLHIGKVAQKGIYAPLTFGGKIVVDGVAASCMSEVSNHSLIQSIYSNFVKCETEDLKCSLKDSVVRLALDMAKIVLPSY